MTFSVELTLLMQGHFVAMSCFLLIMLKAVICLNLHHFLYAWVLGAYHVNVIYTGPSMCDFKARHFDFLWVQWFEVVNPGSSGWSASKLDSIHFPPMNKNHSFGFVDPKDVLCGCHILPAFAKGKQQKDGVGISCCAKNGKDYNQYFVGQWVHYLLASSDSIISPQVLWPGPSYVLPLGARCWPLSCASVSIHLQLCFWSGWRCPRYLGFRYRAAEGIGRVSCTS